MIDDSFISVNLNLYIGILLAWKCPRLMKHLTSRGIAWWLLSSSANSSSSCYLDFYPTSSSWLYWVLCPTPISSLLLLIVIAHIEGLSTCSRYTLNLLLLLGSNSIQRVVLLNWNWLLVWLNPSVWVKPLGFLLLALLLLLYVALLRSIIVEIVWGSSKLRFPWPYTCTVVSCIHLVLLKDLGLPDSAVAIVTTCLWISIAESFLIHRSIKKASSTIMGDEPTSLLRYGVCFYSRDYILTDVWIHEWSIWCLYFLVSVRDTILSVAIILAKVLERLSEVPP